MKHGSLKTVGTVLALVLCAVFLFLLVCNVTIIVKSTLHPETPPTVFGVAPMVVLSGSMSGSADGHIEVGDLIFVTEADIDSLKVGDVVSYMQGRTVVTHRLISVETGANGETLYITKGDANNAPDEPILAGDIVGVCRFRIPKLGNQAANGHAATVSFTVVTTVTQID